MSKTGGGRLKDKVACHVTSFSVVGPPTGAEN
jgi:hypothetical protein